MAMQLMDRASFERELKNAGLTPTEKCTKHGKIWKTDDGDCALVPNVSGDIPDSILETVLNKLNKLYR